MLVGYLRVSDQTCRVGLVKPRYFSAFVCGGLLAYRVTWRPPPPAPSSSNKEGKDRVTVTTKKKREKKRHQDTSLLDPQRWINLGNSTRAQNSKRL